MKLGFFLSSLIIISIAILPFKVNAATSDSITINAIPENPSPGESVTVTLESYTYNLDNVSISWLVNGKNVSSGIGKKSLSVAAPALGSQTTITAIVALKSGTIEEKTVIRPAIMTLLWQANDSYVPPFYKGKALPSPDSEIKVVAMPEVRTNSKIVDPQNMIYTWKKDYTNDAGSSGYGKNFYIYTSDYLDASNNISVTTGTTDQNYSSDASIDIRTVDPKIEFYKKNLTLGTIWEQALGDGHKIVGDEIIEAAPYFISPKDIRNPMLGWSWSINDSSVSVTGLRKDLLPIKAQTGISGTSKINLEIDNSEKIFETAKKEINVEF